MSLRSIIVTLLVFAACKDAPPRTLGPLLAELPRWQQDCSSPLIEQAVAKGPDPLMAGQRYRPDAFQTASTRYVCSPPGWSLYADAKGHLIGFCVDDKRLPPQETHIDRARRLLANHFPNQFVADITEGTCTWEPTKVAHGLLRWNQYLPFVIGPDGERTYHPPVGTLKACCWQVTNP